MTKAQIPLHTTGTPAPHDGVYAAFSHQDGSDPHPEPSAQSAIKAGTPLPPCKTCGKPVKWLWSQG